MPRIYSKKTIIAGQTVEKIATYLFQIAKIFSFAPTNDQKEIRRILLFEPFQMGDIISLTVMFASLKDQYPFADIYLLTQHKNKHVLASDPRVKEVLTASFPWSTKKKSHTNFSQWISLYHSLKKLRKKGFDLGIDTRGEIRSHLVMVLVGCVQRIGYTNYMGSNFHVQGSLLTTNLGNLPAMNRFELNMWVLSKGLGCSQKILFPSLETPNVDPLVLSTKCPQIIVHIGAGWEFRRWEAKKWIQFLNTIYSDYNILIVLIGSRDEKDIVEKVSSGLTFQHHLVITSFEEMIALFKGSQLFIGIDSGPMNLAVALGIKVLALFGPGDTKIWSPYGKKNKYVYKASNYPCAPCLQKECVQPLNSCMAAIDVSDVLPVFDEMFTEILMESRSLMNNGGLGKVKNTLHNLRV